MFENGTIAIDVVMGLGKLRSLYMVDEELAMTSWSGFSVAGSPAFRLDLFVGIDCFNVKIFSSGRGEFGIPGPLIHVHYTAHASLRRTPHSKSEESCAEWGGL